jgi:hypothetical protein
MYMRVITVTCEATIMMGGMVARETQEIPGLRSAPSLKAERNHKTPLSSIHMHMYSHHAAHLSFPSTEEKTKTKKSPSVPPFPLGYVLFLHDAIPDPDTAKPAPCHIRIPIRISKYKVPKWYQLVSKREKKGKKPKNSCRPFSSVLGGVGACMACRRGYLNSIKQMTTKVGAAGVGR